MLPRHPNASGRSSPTTASPPASSPTATTCRPRCSRPCCAPRGSSGCSGLRRTALAGRPPGRYEQPVGGRVDVGRTAGCPSSARDLLAGAGVDLAHGLRHLVADLGLDWATALALATTTPGRVMARPASAGRPAGRRLRPAAARTSCCWPRKGRPVARQGRGGGRHTGAGPGVTGPAYPLRAGAAAASSTWSRDAAVRVRGPGGRRHRHARPVTARALAVEDMCWVAVDVCGLDRATCAVGGRAGGAAGRARGGDGHPHALGAGLYARPAGRGRPLARRPGGRRRRRCGHPGVGRPAAGTPVVAAPIGAGSGRRPPPPSRSRGRRPSTSCGWWPIRRGVVAGWSVPLPPGGARAATARSPPTTVSLMRGRPAAQSWPLARSLSSRRGVPGTSTPATTPRRPTPPAPSPSRSFAEAERIGGGSADGPGAGPDPDGRVAGAVLGCRRTVGARAGPPRSRPAGGAGRALDGPRPPGPTGSGGLLAPGSVGASDEPRLRAPLEYSGESSGGCPGAGSGWSGCPGNRPFLRRRPPAAGRHGSRRLVVGYAGGCPGLTARLRWTTVAAGYEVLDAHRYYGMPAPFASGQRGTAGRGGGWTGVDAMSGRGGCEWIGRAARDRPSSWWPRSWACRRRPSRGPSPRPGAAAAGDGRAVPEPPLEGSAVRPQPRARPGADRRADGRDRRIVVTDIANPFFPPLIRHIHSTADGAGSTSCSPTPTSKSPTEGGG